MLILYIDMGASSHRHEEMSVDCRYCFYRGVSFSHPHFCQLLYAWNLLGDYILFFLINLWRHTWIFWVKLSLKLVCCSCLEFQVPGDKGLCNMDVHFMLVHLFLLAQILPACAGFSISFTQPYFIFLYLKEFLYKRVVLLIIC